MNVQSLEIFKITQLEANDPESFFSSQALNLTVLEGVEHRCDVFRG